ncbi:MAG: GIY-YIG nuclease family protein [Bacteroidales bacterium]|nr:GIY-YIG nuclease family protein [Bacteroidales bacterium]
MKGYMYILQCSNGAYYTGSTINLERRLKQHQNGEGANFHANICLLNWYILKNFKELTKLFIEKNKFKNGAEARKRR